MVVGRSGNCGTEELTEQDRDWDCTPAVGYIRLSWVGWLCSKLIARTRQGWQTSYPDSVQAERLCARQ